MYKDKCEIYTNQKRLEDFFTHKEFNMRHLMWLELIKNYSWAIKYHPGKPNVEANTLSWKAVEKVSSLIAKQSLLIKDIERLNVGVVLKGGWMYMVAMVVTI
jgi:hypothetical protein